eukprot:s53_g5.t2
MVIVSAAVASLAAGNAFCLYRFLFARQYHAWKLETAADLQALVLPSFRCPISQEVMREPVVTCDGQTYEKQNIQEWFRRGTQTSPLTNLPLDSKEVVPNLALRQAVADFNTKVCPVLREEFENRKRLENRVEVLLQREAQLQQEIAGQDGRRDEAMQALLESLEEREAEVVALRKGKEDVLKDMERLRQTHQEELIQQQEEQNKAVELVEAEKQVALTKSKAEADSLRRQRDNAVSCRTAPMTLDAFDASNASNATKCTDAIHRLARSGAKKLPPELRQALEQQMPRVGAPQLARQAWALGRIGDEGIAHPAAVASTTWAVARHRLQLPHGFVGFVKDVLVKKQFKPQDASLTLWALAKLRVTRSQLGQLPVLKGAIQWSTRDASTAMWACATMQTKPARPTLDIWCNALLEKMHLCTQQAAANAMWALVQLQRPQRTLLSNVAWAYAFATTLLGRLEMDEGFLNAVRAQLHALGQEQDGKVPLVSLTVIYKPPGWEVDGHETEPDSHALRRASDSAFVQLHAVFSIVHCEVLLTLFQVFCCTIVRGICSCIVREICYNREEFVARQNIFVWRLSDFVKDNLDSRTVYEGDRGFLHRLDVQSSGLVIHAETYQALMDLRWQQDTFQVLREYLVLVHENWTSRDSPDAPALVDVFVLNDRLEEVTGGCRVGFGRPSRSLLRPLAHFTHRSKGSKGSKSTDSTDFTLLVIRIVTGRRHQIRVQLASRGHPVVGDGRYGYGTDFTFCPRLFLHRHRLSFHCDGEPVSVTEQLPEDLRHVLDGMELVELGSRARNGNEIADIASALPSVIIQGLRRSSQPKASNLSGPRVTDLLEVDLGSQSETLEAEPPGSVGHGTRSSSVDSALPALPKDLAMAPGFSSLRPEVGEKPSSTSGSEGHNASSSALFGRFSQVRSATSHGSARQRSSSATMQQRSERPARSTMFRNLFRRPTNPAAGAT